MPIIPTPNESDFTKTGIGICLAFLGGIFAQVAKSLLGRWKTKGDQQHEEDLELRKKSATVETTYISSVDRRIEDLYSELKDTRAEVDRVRASEEKQRVDYRNEAFEQSVRHRAEVELLERRNRELEKEIIVLKGRFD